MYIVWESNLTSRFVSPSVSSYTFCKKVAPKTMGNGKGKSKVPELLHWFNDKRNKLFTILFSLLSESVLMYT